MDNDELYIVDEFRLDDGRRAWHIPSRTRSDWLYTVIVCEYTVTCDCPGFQYRSHCAHADYIEERLADEHAEKHARLEHDRQRDTAPILRSNAPFSIFKQD